MKNIKALSLLLLLSSPVWAAEYDQQEQIPDEYYQYLDDNYEELPPELYEALIAELSPEDMQAYEEAMALTNNSSQDQQAVPEPHITTACPEPMSIAVGGCMVPPIEPQVVREPEHSDHGSTTLNTIEVSHEQPQEYFDNHDLLPVAQPVPTAHVEQQAAAITGSTVPAITKHRVTQKRIVKGQDSELKHQNIQTASTQHQAVSSHEPTTKLKRQRRTNILLGAKL